MSNSIYIQVPIGMPTRMNTAADREKGKRKCTEEKSSVELMLPGASSIHHSFHSCVTPNRLVRR